MWYSYDDFKLLSHVTWLDETCHEIENHGEEKEDISCDTPISETSVVLLYKR